MRGEDPMIAQMLRRCCRIIVGLPKTIFRKLIFLFCWGKMVIMSRCGFKPSEKTSDSGKPDEPTCYNCEQLQRELQLARSKASDDERSFNERLQQWKMKYETLDNSSKKLTEQMADILERGGTLENVNDEHANTKLGKRFEKLYTKEWVELCEWLEDNVKDLLEIERIRLLKSILMKSYNICEGMAKRQLQDFLFMDGKVDLPTDEEISELITIRRQYGQKYATRTNITKKITNAVLEGNGDEYLILRQDGVKKKLREFLEKFVDCCWLMTISQPRLVLLFDVTDQQYEGKLKELFKQYSCQETVVDKTKKTECILEVVWPCVQLEDGSGFFAKGDVITVGEGI